MVGLCIRLDFSPTKVGVFLVGLCITLCILLPLSLARTGAFVTGLCCALLLVNFGDFWVGLGIVSCIEFAFILALVFTLTFEFALMLDSGLAFVVGDFFLSPSILTPTLVISSSVFRIISSSDPRSLSMAEVDVPDLSISLASLIRSEDMSDKSAIIFDRLCISFAFFCMAAACCD